MSQPMDRGLATFEIKVRALRPLVSTSRFSVDGSMTHGKTAMSSTSPRRLPTSLVNFSSARAPRSSVCSLSRVTTGIIG